ncbi:hypothetical protein M885DRAFT_621856 [Pelagophyceae sp. CCMP2097]|nr:hypothetical protein M885DRAFT_621856 [Pelagophyceae sp. CCMP2097]
MEGSFSKRRHLSAPWLVALETLDLAPLSRPEASQSFEDSGTAAQDVELQHTLRSAPPDPESPLTHRSGANACESGSRIPLLIVELESILHSADTDMIATVVDSTSRMIAQLHSDVFRDVGAPDVQAGSVLVLRGAVVLASPSARVLNVHARNVILALSPGVSLPPHARPKKRKRGWSSSSAGGAPQHARGGPQQPPPPNGGGPQQPPPPSQSSSLPSQSSAPPPAPLRDDGRSRRRPSDGDGQSSSSQRLSPDAPPPRAARPSDASEASNGGLSEAWSAKWISRGASLGLINDWHDQVRVAALATAGKLRTVVGQCRLELARQKLEPFGASAQLRQSAMAIDLCLDALLHVQASRQSPSNDGDWIAPGTQSTARTRCICGDDIPRPAFSPMSVVVSTRCSAACTRASAVRDVPPFVRGQPPHPPAVRHVPPPPAQHVPPPPPPSVRHVPQPPPPPAGDVPRASIYDDDDEEGAALEALLDQEERSTRDVPRLAPPAAAHARPVSVAVPSRAEDEAAAIAACHELMSQHPDLLLDDDNFADTPTPKAPPPPPAAPPPRVAPPRVEPPRVVLPRVEPPRVEPPRPAAADEDEDDAMDDLLGGYGH